MNKIAILALASAALIATACQNTTKPTNLQEVYANNLASAKTVDDSIVATSGTFVGAYFNLNTERLPIKVNKPELLRGLRHAMSVDTTNLSYRYGLQMGLQVLTTYKELAAGTDISKEAFIAAISSAFNLDSLTVEQFEEIRPEFEKAMDRAQELAKERQEAEVFASQQAIDNRLMDEIVAEKLQNNPEFKAVGSEGVLKRFITAGDGEVIDPTMPLSVSYSINRIDSGALIRKRDSARVFTGHANDNLLATVLPFMSIGETAEFFVPYEVAYGIIGNSRIGVGPCESVMITISVAVPQPKND